MIMAGLEFMEDIPFRDIYITGLVRDLSGRKMSKSLGNGIDPLEIVDEFGADAMRFTLAFLAAQGQDVLVGKESFGVGSRFANKLWNASRYLLMNLEGRELLDSGRIELNDIDKWIVHRLNETAKTVGEAFQNYRFNDAASSCYEFFWNEFCDWYIEMSKSQLADEALRQSTARNLIFVLDQALRLLHPYMPFITEKIWQSIPHGSASPSLMVAAWPESAQLAACRDEEAEEGMELLIDVVTAIRSVRARYTIAPKQQLSVVVSTAGARAGVHAESLTAMSPLIAQLGNVQSFRAAPDVQKPAHASVTVAGELEIFVELEGLVDFELERERLTKEQAKLEAECAKLEKKLSTEGFLAKAAPEIIEKTRTEHAETRDALERIATQLESLS
jgi:valyl-tRNA synthetase